MEYEYQRMSNYLSEQLKTITNLCKIAQMLIDNNEPELLPTILELMQLEIQDVIEENCVIDMPDNPEFRYDRNP